ncbi:MAG: hypothetical protein Q8R25_00895 [bacterium]|nr:hypothetical protein [bacterium]
MAHLHDMEKMVRERREMLSSIARDISEPLFEALERKLEHEHASFLTIIESEASAVAVNKELNKTLKSEFFVRRLLSKNIL